MISELEKLGINLKNRTSGQFQTTCPKCSHERKKKKSPCLSVNIDEGVYNCHHCGWTGNVMKLKSKSEKQYKKPVEINSPVGEKALQWFSQRGISEKTISDLFVSETKEFMPQAGKEMTCICFKYYRGVDLVNIKYRDSAKNFKMVKDAELIFYNLNSIASQDYCIITEGEIDALSFHEAGFSSVVSVPNGASKGNQNLEYVDNCWEDFESIPKIIIATDGDYPGQLLREELARRFGKERCYIFQYPEGVKDANEILIELGVEGLQYCFERVIEYPIEGITKVEDMESDIDYLYEHGYPVGDKIGFGKLDEHISWRGGEMTIITGIPGSGKSEFIDQVMVLLAKNHGWKFGVWSAENQPSYLHFAKLAEKFIAKGSFYADHPNFKMTSDEIYKAKVFLNKHFIFINFTDENLTVDGIIAKAKELNKKYGIKGFLIDPYNYIEHKIPSGYTETQYISELLTKLSRTCKSLGIHILLVAHPTKIAKKDGVYDVPTLYNISGSAHFFNKTDNGMVVYRDFETNIVTVHIQKIRFKFIGKIGNVEFNYNKQNGTYHEVEF